MNTNSRLIACAAMIVASNPVTGNIGNGFNIVGPFAGTDDLRAKAKDLLSDTAQARWTEVSFSYVTPSDDDRAALDALTDGTVKCLIVLKSEDGDLTKGFDLVGPFVSDEALAAYVEAEIDTSTHWTEAEMTYVSGQIETPDHGAGSGGTQQEAPAAA
jgi:hypothetical protein